MTASLSIDTSLQISDYFAKVDFWPGIKEEALKLNSLHVGRVGAELVEFAWEQDPKLRIQLTRFRLVVESDHGLPPNLSSLVKAKLAEIATRPRAT